MATVCLRKWRIWLVAASVIVVGGLLFIGSRTTIMNSVIKPGEKFSGYRLSSYSVPDRSRIWQNPTQGVLNSNSDKNDNKDKNANGFNFVVRDGHKGPDVAQPDRQKEAISKHTSYTNNSLSGPEYLRSQLWQNLTQGVLNCQTGAVVRTLDRPDGQKPFSVTLLPASWKSEDKESRKMSFIDIFKKKAWGGQKAPPSGSDVLVGSGPGSTLENSVQVRKTLDVVIAKVKTLLGKSSIRMLDIPCGDLTWMSEFIKDRKDVEYYGMDIVPDIIEHHQRVYTPKYPHMTFINQDIVAEPLHAKFDLIHTRQMTQHLTSADTMTVFKHFKDSGSHFLMSTTIPKWRNTDLNRFSKWRYRGQDLEGAPFLLPAPICQSRDGGMEFNAVWLMNS